jgi:hypothetical protein
MRSEIDAVAHHVVEQIAPKGMNCSRSHAAVVSGALPPPGLSFREILRKVASL